MDAYQVIKKKLASHPKGAPDLPELDEILHILFTPEEADLSQHLTFHAEPADVIAKLTGLSVDEVTSQCETMAKKGIVLARTKKGVRVYTLLPVAPGLYEYPIMLGPRAGLDYERLCNLWLQYYESGWGREMGSTKPVDARVLPIMETLEDTRTILPFEQISDYIEAANTISVGKCACRMVTKCKFPLETCFFLNSHAKFLIKIGAAREVSKAEAIDILRGAEKVGLVHVGANSATGGDVICNCCSCCCIMLRSRIKFYKEGSPQGAYLCRVDEEECTACGTCLDRCPTKCITVDAVAVVDASMCLGCGLCASVCPSEAMKLIRKADALQPLPSMRDWAYQVGAKKGVLEEYKKNLLSQSERGVTPQRKPNARNRS